jgi:CRISPR-associated protein Csm1
MHNTNWLTQLKEALNSDVGLTSIMQQVDIGAKSKGNGEKLLPRTLRVKDTFLINQKGNILAEFDADLAALRNAGLEQDDYSIFHFVQKYGWRAPSAVSSNAGVSFFDDLRIEEALAACKGSTGYRLVKGDLTGIQDFIEADINLGLVGGAKNIAKRLRGKSFFVSVMTDFLAESLLESLNLPVWNLLFAGGGHFNLLIPDDPATLQKMEDWEKSTLLDMTHQLSGLLGLVIASVPCGQDFITHADKYFDKVNKERDVMKYRKGFSFLSDLFSNTKVKNLEQKRFEDIGKKVPKYNHLLWVKSTQNINSDNETELTLIYKSVLGQSLYLTDKPLSIKDFVQKNAANIQQVRFLSLNDTEFLQPNNILLAGRTSLGFRFVGNETPKDRHNELKDFEDITQEKGTDGKIMYEMLSVMRLDVDDLGCIFSKGLQQASLKQVVALSREMSFFFAGYFNHLARQENIYVVYSGGDDAFVVGHWKNMLRFARLLEQDFKKFVGNNPNIHFSAGIFTCDAHYPVAKFSEDAKDLLDKDAKKIQDKNAISVFNHCLKWDDFGSMIDFGETLLRYTESGNEQKGSRIARSVVNRILSVVKNSFHEKTELDESKKVVKRGYLKPETFYRNIANLKYLLARQGFDDKAMSEQGQKTGNIEGDVIKIILDAFEKSKNGDVQAIAANNLRVALNYTLYSLRKPKKEA